MRSIFTSLLLGCVGLALATENSTSSSNDDFHITNLKITKVYNANVTMAFTVYDPDPLTNATKNCKTSWKSGSGGYPDGPYAICGESTFAWTMERFTSIRNFEMSVEHSYKDPAVGQPPYNVITTFAQANVSMPAITCSRSAGQVICQQPPGTVIKAPVYAAVAK